MRVLAFASQKAGAGKTTLAGHVAVQAQRNNVGTVAVIDVDPEAHLADWCAKRAEQPLKHIQATQAELQQTIQSLIAEGVELTIIDTPPALSHSIEAVLQVADLIAIPTRPYGHDLEAANATAELARQAGKPFVFIVNGAQVDAELAPDVVMTLAQYGPVATTQVPRSLAFVDAMIEGRTVMEAGTEQPVAASLEALWQYLLKRFPKKSPIKQAIAGAAAASQGLFSAKAPSRRTETLSPTDEPSKAEILPEVEETAPAIVAAPAHPPKKAASPMRPERRKDPSDATAPRIGGVVRKRRIGRIVLAASLGLIGLVGVGAVVAVNNLDPKTYAGLITSAVEGATGRQLKIDGDIDVAIGLTPRIVIEKVSFSNPAWSKEPVMAAADRLEVEIRLIPLLFGNVKIKRIVLAGAQVNLEQAADGRTNWSFDNSATPAGAPVGDEGESGLPEIHQIRIENSKLVYVNRVTKERHEADIEQLKLAADGFDQPLEFDLAAMFDGQPVQASGDIDNLQALMNSGDVSVDIVAQSGESRLALEGNIEAPYLESDMDIQVDGSGPALADIGRPFGIALSEHGPFKISGAVSGGDKQYRIDDLDASFARSDLKGTASLDMRGARPAFTGVLKSEHLDLADITAPEPESAEPDDGRIFSDDKLPFDALKTVDGDLTFDAKSFVSNSVELSDVTGHLVLDNGVATLSPFRAGISGGQLDLSSIIDASGRTPAVTLRTNADGVSGNDLLGLLGLDGILGGGRADLTLDVRGQGHSLHDLMGGLNGTGQLHMAGGYINNEFARFLLADMTQMIATAGQGGAGVSCLTTIFDAKKGIATSRNTVIDAPGAAIVGTGRINLNKETISMRFEPVAKQLGLSQFAIPVDVVGPLASPNVTTDAVDSAAKVVGTTAGLATDNVLGILGNATGVQTGQVSRTVPSCGGGSAPVSTAIDPPEAAPVEEAVPAPKPAATSQTATTSTSTKKKPASTSSSSSSTLDQASEFIGNVGSSVNGLFEGSTSSDAADKTNKTNK